jgi:hypothetical protein
MGGIVSIIVLRAHPLLRQKPALVTRKVAWLANGQKQVQPAEIEGRKTIKCQELATTRLGSLRL